MQESPRRLAGQQWKSIFPDLQKEKEEAEAIKRRPSILVILGNPPYNGYPGIAKIDEERDLTREYRYTIPGMPEPEGAGLNDLYVRFFRIAERRILRNNDGKGIMSFISNYSWLDGFFHPTMRFRLLNAFDNLFIDNLNGDAYRTGKVTLEGKPDPSAFSTPRNRVGIQVGTAISTLVRGASATENNGLHIRNLWGTEKLQQLLHESEGSGPDNYEMLIPEPKLGIPFAKLKYIPQYLDWPLYIELFPQSSPGLTTSRDPVVVDIDRSALETRIKRYLDPSVSDAEITAELPVAMRSTNRFDALDTRAQLLERGFRGWQILPYAYRPFDERWVYWESQTKLLDEKRLGYLKDLDYLSPALVLTQQSRKTFDGPMVISALMDFNVADGAAAAFPEFVISSSMHEESPRVPNLSKPAWSYIEATGVTPRELMLHALSVTHSPNYQRENSGALLRDFPRIPLPSSKLDSAEFDPSFMQPFVLNPKGYLGECIGR